MIAVDPSALIAILKREPEREAFARTISDADDCFLSAVGFLETTMVLIGRGPPHRADELESILNDLAITLVPFDERQARISRDAFIRYGKGRHPAGLNFGDCISYALAQSLRLPLLFKGADFAKTDVVPALLQPGA